MTPAQINTTNKTTSLNMNYHLLVQANSAEFTEDEIREIFEKYGKIRRLKSISKGKQAHISYGNFFEAVAALQGVHDKPPLKLQVDYYKKDDDFISRYEYTHCRITWVDPIKRLYRVRRVEDEKNYKKFQEKLQEASNKCSETIDVDKLVVGNVYSIMYGEVWKRGKILSISPIEIDLIDDGITLKPPVQITSYKKLGKLAENDSFAGCLKIKVSPDNEKKGLHTGSYVEIRMIGQHENMDYVVTKSDETINNNINNKSTSSIENIITSTQKDNVESKSNESTDILPSDICIFDSFETESSIEISISDQIDLTTATAVFLYTVKGSFQLLDKLNEHCNRLVQSYNNYKPSINEYICFKQCGHINWYRGIVLSAGELIKVASLDQGIETIAHKIIPVPDMFKNIPALAVQIKTHDKFPYSIGDSADLYICDIDKESKTVIAKFTNVKTNSGVQISQWTPWIKNGKSIDNAAAKVAETIPTARIVPLNTPRVENSIPIVQEIRPTIVEKENIVIPVIEKCSSTVDENPAPKIDKKITIEDFNLKNGSRVVVQSYLGTSVVCIASMELDDIVLKKELNQKICDTAKTSDSIDHPNVGDYVLACYNDNYYRAKVLSIRNKKIVADFIDFGLVEIIKPGNIKKIPESLMEHPSLMKQVTLKNVDNNQPTKEAANYIKSLFATEEILICSFDDNLPDKVELKTLDNESVNDEINKLSKKYDKENIISTIPNPKPQLRLNIIKREEIIGITARKDANKSESSKASKTIEEKSQSGSSKRKSSKEKKLTTESSSSSSKRKSPAEISSSTKSSSSSSSSSTKPSSSSSSTKPSSSSSSTKSSSSSSKRKLPTEISTSTKSSSSPSSLSSTEKRIKLTESSKNCESINDKHKSSTKSSSKDKSPEPVTSSKKSIISPIESLKPRKECGYCGKFNHETYECTFKKDSERRYHELRNQEIRRRGFEHYHDGRLPGPPRYPDIRSYDQTQRLYYDQLPVCPHESCLSNKSQYDPRKGPVKHCYQDCPFSQCYTPIY